MARAGQVLEVGRVNAPPSRGHAGSAGDKNPSGSGGGGGANGDNDYDWPMPPGPDEEMAFDPALTEYASAEALERSGCGHPTNCNACLDIGSGDLAAPGHGMCVWCASSGTCIERTQAFDLFRKTKMDDADEDGDYGTCRAGIATMPHHCGEVTDKIESHFKARDDPAQAKAEAVLAKDLAFTITVGWPQQGEWVGHLEPTDIALKGFFQADEGKPTLVDICYSLFGPSSSGKPLQKRCRSIRTPELGNLSFPEPGPYMLHAWALDNVDDRLLSPLTAVAFDRLPSALYEEGCFSPDPHAPGFPRQTESSGLSTLMLQSNQRLFGGVTGEETPLVFRPSGFDAGITLDLTTSRVVHTFWWEGQQDMIDTSKQAKRGATQVRRPPTPLHQHQFDWFCRLSTQSFALPSSHLHSFSPFFFAFDIPGCPQTVPVNLDPQLGDSPQQQPLDLPHLGPCLDAGDGRNGIGRGLFRAL